MSIDEKLDVADHGYAVRVGGRLRAIRKQKRLSLQDVEAGSGQEFKASVLGAYERGERAISVPRLQRLARSYAVPVDQLLPRILLPQAVSQRAHAVLADQRCIQRGWQEGQLGPLGLMQLIPADPEVRGQVGFGRRTAPVPRGR